MKIRRREFEPPVRRFVAVAAALIAPFVHAQTTEAPPCAADDTACQNARVSGTWSQQTGQAQPSVSTDANGERKLEWRGSVTARGYTNRIEPGGPGRANTPANNGSFGLASIVTELRLPDLDGASSTSLQFAGQASNDRSVMSLYPSQVQNLSVNRQGPTWAMQFGDYAANFSQLGLQLGYRGAYVHREFGGLKAAVLMGSVADSWDGLYNRRTIGGQPARSRYLRDITGVYLGQTLSERMQVFGSVGIYKDRMSSVPDEMQTLPAADSRSFSFGFSYRADPFTLAGEVARSSFADSHSADRRNDEALMLDATYRFERANLRTGVRRLGSSYTALSQSLQPGIEELYLAGDASPLSWLQLNADVRRTGMRIAATSFSPERSTSGVRVALGANLMLNALVDGLSANWQASTSDDRDPQDNRSRQGQTSVGLNWQNRLVSVGLNVVENRTRTPAYPGADSDSHGVQAQLGVPFGMNADIPGWAGQVLLTAGVQRQALLAIDSSSRNLSYGLSAQVGKQGVLQLSTAFTEQVSVPPGDLLRIRQRQFQLDMQRPITTTLDAKTFARWAWMNVGNPELLGTERVIGIELQQRW